MIIHILGDIVYMYILCMVLYIVVHKIESKNETKLLKIKANKVPLLMEKNINSVFSFGLYFINFVSSLAFTVLIERSILLSISCIISFLLFFRITTNSIVGQTEKKNLHSINQALT